MLPSASVPVAQWIERLPPKQQVARSIRAGDVDFLVEFFYCLLFTNNLKYMGMRSYLCIISIFLNLTVWGEVPLSLQQAMGSLSAFPRTQPLVQIMEQEGVAVGWAAMAHCTAMWNGGSRTILLNSSYAWSEGQKIVSILMEMHNARSNSALAKVDRLAWQGRLSKWEYVEAIERIEHANALQTSTLLKEGVAQGYFPPDARYRIYPQFQDHYALQRKSGHSSLIAQRYNDLVSMHG